MKDKPFLNLEQQIMHLNNDKKILCKDENRKDLIRIGYFNLINGYKSPFTSFKDKDGNHVYEKGTTIDHLIYLNKFDNQLRILLFKVLIKIEQEIRSIASYLFEKTKNSKLTWRSSKVYNDKIATSEISRLISQIDKEIKERKNCEYINFYKEKHKTLPMWIVTKTINFSTFINLISISKDDVYLNLTRIYDIKGNSNIDKKGMLKDLLHWIRIVRNACAHNERVYCLKGNKRLFDDEILKLRKSYRRNFPNQSIFDLIIYCRYFLEKDEYKEFVLEIKSMLLDLKSKLSSFSFGAVRGQLGIKCIDDLDIISNDGFDNFYEFLDNKKPT